MLADILVGLIFAIIIALGVIYFIKNARNHTCPGCAGGCSREERARCKRS
jgi:membrane-associated phospholipid phosphatase